MVRVVQWAIMNRVRQFILGRITKHLTQPHSYNFRSCKDLISSLIFFRLSGCNQIQALGCQVVVVFYQSIDQDVKAAHALRERYAPPMQSNFRVSAVLRFQRKVCMEGLVGEGWKVVGWG